jgi:predicted nucleotidyltransferase
MNTLIAQHHDELLRLCRQHAVSRLALFGSAAQGGFSPVTSDLDFLVSFSEPQRPGYADRYLAFAEALEHLFGRRVDLVTERSVRNPVFRAAVESALELLYDERSEKAAA